MPYGIKLADPYQSSNIGPTQRPPKLKTPNMFKTPQSADHGARVGVKFGTKMKGEVRGKVTGSGALQVSDIFRE